MTDYSVLALIAQLLHQRHKGAADGLEDIKDSLCNSHLIKRILEYDLEEITDLRRQNEMKKIISLLLVFFLKRNKKKNSNSSE